MGLISQMMTNLYRPPKQENAPATLSKNLTPAKAAQFLNQTNVTQGQFLKGQVLDLRANQIMVLLENGFTVSARTEGTLNLSIGENARFFVAQTTEDQILLKLAKEDGQNENPMIDRALTAANIQKTERSVSIVTELLNHQQPANEATIRHYLSLSAKYPELPVKDLILMELHHIPVTKENVEQFASYQDRNAKLLTQTKDLLQNLSEAIRQIPEGPAKQEVLQELKQMVGMEHTSPKMQSVTGTTPEQTTVYTQDTKQPLMPENVNETTADATANIIITNSGTPILSEALPHVPESRTEAEPLLKEFLNSFMLEPGDVADPEKVQKYYDELNEKLAQLEQLTRKVTEHTAENHVVATPKQMRQNLSFMEAVNNVFPYVQLPLKFRETPTHGELYVYEKKKTLKSSDTLSALLHLEMEALGTTDIFITLTGSHVTTRFSMTDKESGNLIRTELPKLTEALAAKGYTLTSEVAVREPEDNATPTLLEQFLEEHAPGGLNRYTFDIRA